MAKGIILASNVSVVADQPGVQWTGGKAAIVLDATTYPTTCNLQAQGPGGSWISLNSTTFSANQVTAFDLPAGLYRIHMASGTVAAFYASLVSI